MTQVEARNMDRCGRESVDSVPPARHRVTARLVAALPMFAAMVTILVFLPFAPLHIDGLHDAIVLKPALDVLSGQALYRDSMSFYGSLNTYLQAGFLALLGPKLISIKLGTVAMYGLASGFLAAAWGRLLPPSLTVLSLVLWLSLAYFYDGNHMFAWPSVNSLAFQAAALYFLMKSASPAGVRSPVFPLLCGVSAGLCYWCRFNVGLPLIAALVASYMILARAVGERPLTSRRLYLFLAGNVAVHLAFLAVIVGTHATTDWIYLEYTWPGKLYIRSKSETFWMILRSLFIPPALQASFQSQPMLPLVSILGVIAALVLVFLFSIPAGATGPGADRGEERPHRRYLGSAVVLLVLALPIFILAMSRAPFEKRFWHYFEMGFWFYFIPYVLLGAMVAISANWLLSRGRVEAVAGPGPVLPGYLAGLVALASWTQYFPASYVNYCWWGLAPGIGVFTFFVLRLARGRVLAVMMALSALMIPLVYHQSRDAMRTLRQPYVTIRNNPVLSGMKVSPHENALWSPFLAALDAYLAKRPQTALLAYGLKPIYATLVPDQSNPSNIWVYDRVLPIPRPDEVLARRREFIREHRPLIAFNWEDPFGMDPVRIDRRIESNLELKAILEEIVREFHYVELAHVDRVYPHLGNVVSTDILLAPPDDHPGSSQAH